MAKYSMVHLLPRGTDNWPHDSGERKPSSHGIFTSEQNKELCFTNMQNSGLGSTPLEKVGIESHIVKELVIDEEIEHGMAALALASGVDPTWIMDLGASKHFIGNPHVFSSLEVSHNPSPVLSAGGQTHEIHGRGNVDFELPFGEI